MDKEKAKKARITGIALLASGATVAMHHKINYGRWCDKDKKACHGKAGMALAGTGLLLGLISHKL